MTQEEKLQKLTVWLVEQGVDCYKPKKGHKYPEGVRLVVGEPHIYVCIVPPGEEDGTFKAVGHYTKPFFIRETEDTDFIIHKMRNALKGWNTVKARLEDEKARVEALRPRRKRERIHVVRKPIYEKVGR